MSETSVFTGNMSRLWLRVTPPVCVQVGRVPGAQLPRPPLHPGEEGLQQLLGLGEPEQHRGLHAESPLHLKPARRPAGLTHTNHKTLILIINCLQKEFG